jgi:hypothetical protein
MSRLWVVAVVALALMPVTGAGAQPRKVVGCHARADFNLLISSARNMRCRNAARELRRYKGSIKRRFTTPHGFHCKRASGGRLAGQWRCARRTKAFRFEFSD